MVRMGMRTSALIQMDMEEVGKVRVKKEVGVEEVDVEEVNVEEADLEEADLEEVKKVKTNHPHNHSLTDEQRVLCDPAQLENAGQLGKAAESRNRPSWTSNA
ncbi:hypothetical protein CYMTET_29001 [Cymbomonas tetramitiformis]|uniref:Uncharacterized protein n=1 Tax=Cymbomonas tetramitiformis TaxID=36881 RepID=A0AAE0KVL0_9CHLO|nr:hypothetical protein CYMTET_29001 [Cymbomonas tetramitiformis]